MRFLVVVRSVAVVTSVITLVTLLLNGSFERPGESAFLVPDLLLSAALLIGAALPATGARTVLTFAFGLSAGVFTSAFFSHLVGEEGAAAWRVSGVLMLALGSMIMTLLLTRPAGMPTSA
jgi:hypothetical protein